MCKVKKPYIVFDNFCLRVPLLPLETVLIDLNKVKIEERDLMEKWKNKDLKEALFLASPYLCSELELLFNGKITNVKKVQKLQQSFLKYLIRSSIRCTPFGLFAGVGIGVFESKTKLLLDQKKTFYRQTRLDINYLVSLTNYLENISNIKYQLLFYPNSSLYRVGDQYRYLEFKLMKMKKLYSFQGVEYSVYIERILNRAKHGGTIDSLASIIVENDITKNEAITFVLDLIDNQILISELELSVAGDDMLSQITTVLKRLKGCNNFLSKLKSLEDAISKLDNNLSNTRDNYEKCYSILKSIDVEYEDKFVFQTDLFISNRVNTISLNKKIGDDLQRVLPLLNILNCNTENLNLKWFKKKFLERYETRKVPLLQVLDVETGIGYVNNSSTISDTVPFLSDITLNMYDDTYENIKLTESEIIIQKLLFEALKSKKYNIELKEDLFKSIGLKWENLPDTFLALIEVVCLDNKEDIYLDFIGGSTGASLLARFCDDSKELFDYVKRITSIEQQMNPNKILAEIVHFPGVRIGNVIKRPHFRNYELPYLGKSNLPLGQQINLNDILLFVKNNRIILWSKKLDKEVLPRLTNAHNYSENSLPIYHFLCDLQTQNIRNKLSFSWGKVSFNQSFLPRVCFKNIILSKAKWHVETKKIQYIINLYHDDNELLNTIKVWRNSVQMPQYVQLKEGDNFLLINLESITMIQLLLATVKNTEQFVLEEFLFTGDATVKNVNNKSFTNQVVVSFYNDEKLKNKYDNAR